MKYLVKEKKGKLIIVDEDKELGEISPEATWVEPGMEIEPTEIKSACYKGHIVIDQSLCSKEEWEDYCSRTFPDINGFQLCFMVKGPCGRFH